MPVNEEHSNALVVAVDGATLRPDVRDLLVSAYVDDSVHVPSMFVLRFSDEHHDVLDRVGATVGSRVTVAVQQSGHGAPVELLDGDVTALEKEIDEGGSFAVVRGLDVRHRLQSGATVTAYTSMTVKDVVATVVREAGLTSRVGPFTVKQEHLARHGESDWDFLCRLARRVGAQVWVEGRKICFDTPAAASSAPSRGDSGSDALVVEGGRNLLSLRATVTGTGQVPEVEARGWSVKDKAEVSSSAPSRTASTEQAADPARLARELNGKKHLVGDVALGTQQDVTDRAQTTAGARAGGFAEIEGVVRGNPRLRAAAAVSLVGVGTAFSGKYALTAVRHELDEHEGYLTGFTAADVSDRSVYGVLAAGPTRGPGAADEARAATSAVVTNVKDPDRLGRVKVRFPALSADYESGWARTLQLGAGKDRGAAWLPEVGDEVLVAFGGAFDEPYVLGGLYNGKDVAGQGWAAHVGDDGKVKRRALTSRNGMYVEFVEDGQTDTLAITTNDGAQHLTLTQTGQKGVVLVSQGALEVTADQDVTVTGKKHVSVSTNSGDLSLKAVNVTIEATQSLKLSGAQLTAEGKATAELKGTDVKVSGQAAAELSASGPTTVRGALVKIN